MRPGSVCGKYTHEGEAVVEEQYLRSGQSFDQQPISPLLLAVAGAAAGLTVGWLFFSQSGARLRARLEPALESWTHEIRAFQSTIEKAQEAVNESRQSWDRVRHFAR